MTRRQLPETLDLADHSRGNGIVRPADRSRVTLNMSDMPAPAPPPRVSVPAPVMVPRTTGPTRIRTLRVAGGRDMLHFVTLYPTEEVVIGREETATLVLSDASVSRRHVKVVCTPDGIIQIRDLNSLNGTALTDDLIVKGVPIEMAALNPGSWVEVGGVALRLELLTLDQVGHLEQMVARLEDSAREPGTGLLPASWLEEELPSLMERHRQQGVPLFCILAELDQTETVRNRFGEGVIRDLLNGVCRLLMWRVRQTDFCIQNGPRMTMIVLPGVNLTVGSAVAERLRREVSSYRWPRPLAGTRITISTGLAAWDGQETTSDWIGRALGMLEARRRQLRV